MDEILPLPISAVPVGIESVEIEVVDRLTDGSTDELFVEPDVSPREHRVVTWPCQLTTCLRRLTEDFAVRTPDLTGGPHGQLPPCQRAPARAGQRGIAAALLL
jgi:hypothetical protein